MGDKPLETPGAPVLGRREKPGRGGAGVKGAAHADSGKRGKRNSTRGCGEGGFSLQAPLSSAFLQFCPPALSAPPRQKCPAREPASSPQWVRGRGGRATQLQGGRSHDARCITAFFGLMTLRAAGRKGEPFLPNASPPGLYVPTSRLSHAWRLRLAPRGHALSHCAWSAAHRRPGLFQGGSEGETLERSP